MTNHNSQLIGGELCASLCEKSNTFLVVWEFEAFSWKEKERESSFLGRHLHLKNLKLIVLER